MSYIVMRDYIYKYMKKIGKYQISRKYFYFFLTNSRILYIYMIYLLFNKTNKIMSAIKELLIEMQEMYSTFDLTEMLYPTSMEDEPVNKEAVLKQYQINQSKVTQEDYEQEF